MTLFASFNAVASTWQNFYLLVGAGAATLIGLMFVAVTFGAGMVTTETAATARSFIDPTLNHFVQVLFTACLVTIPSMSATVLGVLALLLGAYRLVFLRRIFRDVLEAHRKHKDIELSDWLSSIVVPLLTYLLLIASAAGFFLGYQAAFNGLAIATVSALFNGILSAWELMLWMVIRRNAKS